MDALFFWVVFAVAREGALTTVKEGTGSEIFSPLRPFPISGDVSLVDWIGGIDLRELSIVAAFILESCLPEPEEVSVPRQKQTAVMNVEGVVDMGTT